MALLRPVRTADELALHGWLVLVVGLLDPSMVVIFEEPNAPRPERPYLTLKALTDARLHQDQSTTTDTPGPTTGVVRETCSHRRGVVSVNVWADAHKSIARELELALIDQRVVDYFDSNKVWVQRVIAKQGDVPVLRDTGYETRTVLDFEYTFFVVRTDEVDAIEHVQLTSTDYDQTFPDSDLPG
jgi:hypothetical protein